MHHSVYEIQMSEDRDGETLSHNQHSVFLLVTSKTWKKATQMEEEVFKTHDSLNSSRTLNLNQNGCRLHTAFVCNRESPAHKTILHFILTGTSNLHVTENPSGLLTRMPYRTSGDGCASSAYTAIIRGLDAARTNPIVLVMTDGSPNDASQLGSLRNRIHEKHAQVSAKILVHL